MISVLPFLLIYPSPLEKPFSGGGLLEDDDDDDDDDDGRVITGSTVEPPDGVFLNSIAVIDKDNIPANIIFLELLKR